MLYGKPYTNEVLNSPAEKEEGYVRIFENKPRPTPNHVCSPDGLWVLPKITVESVRAARRERYEKETDELLKHYQTDGLLGKTATETDPMLKEWREKVNQIKQDLPFPEEEAVQGYYAPLTYPTEPVVETEPPIV